jgi:flavorubredoxin
MLLLMEASINEIGDQIYRISVSMSAQEVPIPGGFTFNQYLIVDEEPLLFHTGHRPFFPLVSGAIEKVLPLKKLRHVGFSHYEQDECGALNEFLATAPNATPLCSQVNAMINGAGMDRSPRVIPEGETLRTGKRTFRWIDTPHLPHAWECGYLFEETTKTLLCGDLFTQPGAGGPPVTESDIIGPSEAMRKSMDYFAHAPNTQALLGKLAGLEPSLLACMHGSAWRGNGSVLLRELGGVIAAR